MLLDPATLDFIWTLATVASLFALSGLTLFALPWTDQEILRVDSAFRSIGHISPDLGRTQTAS
jgi:hypothetical protein